MRDPLFSSVPSQFYVYESHSREVRNLPNNFNLLATGKTTKIQAFKHREYKIWGIVFHPDCTPVSMAERVKWWKEEAKAIPPGQKVLERLHYQGDNDPTTESKNIMANFVNICWNFYKKMGYNL